MNFVFATIDPKKIAEFPGFGVVARRLARYHSAAMTDTTYGQLAGLNPFARSPARRRSVWRRSASDSSDLQPGIDGPAVRRHLKDDVPGTKPPSRSDGNPEADLK